VAKGCGTRIEVNNSNPLLLYIRRLVLWGHYFHIPNITINISDNRTGSMNYSSPEEEAAGPSGSVLIFISLLIITLQYRATRYLNVVIAEYRVGEWKCPKPHTSDLRDTEESAQSAVSHTFIDHSPMPN
jgi:hypothetical protein